MMFHVEMSHFVFLVQSCRMVLQTAPPPKPRRDEGCFCPTLGLAFGVISAVFIKHRLEVALPAEGQS